MRGYGFKPLHLAAYLGRIPAILGLLAAKASPLTKDKFTRTPLHVAAESGSLPAVRILLTSSPKSIHMPDNQGWLPHMWTKDEDVLRALLKSGADINHRDRKRLRFIHWCIQAGLVSLSLAISELGGGVLSQDFTAKSGVNDISFGAQFKGVSLTQG